MAKMCSRANLKERLIPTLRALLVAVTARKLGLFVFASVGFFVLARIGSIAGLTGKTGTPFWIASGFGLALALRGGGTGLLGLACGSFAGAWWSLHPSSALAVAVADTGSAWLAAWLYQRIQNSFSWMGPLREGLSLAAAAVIVSFLSAYTAASALAWTYALPTEAAAEMRLTWLMGDALGVIIGTPVFLLVYNWVRRPVWPPSRSILGLLGTLLLIAAAALVIVRLPERKGLLFLFFWVPLFVGYWFGVRAGTRSVLFSVLALIFIVARYDVSLVHAGAETNRLVLVMFIGGLGVSWLVVAANSVEKFRGLPLFIYAFAVFIGARLFGHIEQTELERQDLRVDQVAAAGNGLVDAHANNFLEALRPTAYVLRDNPRISSAKWADFVEGMKLGGHYSGLAGMGVIYPVAPEKLAEFRTQSRARAIRLDAPDGSARTDRAEHKILALWNSKSLYRPIGLDLADFAPLCAAADKARETGEALLVPSLPVGVGPGMPRKSRLGMMLLWPVYKNGTAATTVEERRREFVCWLTADFDLSGVESNILKKISHPTELSIYYGTEIRPEARVFRHALEKDPQKTLVRSRTGSVVVLNRTFTLAWGVVVEDDSGTHLQQMAGSLTIILAGAFLSMLVLNLRNTAHRVERQVVERTKELQLTNLALMNQKAEVRRLAQIATEARNPIFVTGGELKIQWVNQSFTDFYGYTIEEVFGKRTKDVLTGPDSDLGALDHQREAFYVRKEPVAYEILHYTKAGKKMWVSVSIRPIVDAKGEFERIIGVVTDLTAAKDHEQQLEAATAKAEQASRAKSNLIANVSHELRTPLNVIMGNLQLILAGKYGRFEDGLRAPLQSIEASSQHLLDLIGDLLDVSKAWAGKLELENGPVNIIRLVENAVGMMRVSAEKKQLKLTVEFHHQTDLVEGDELRLQQIALNLLSNAVKFTPAGGTVTVRVEETAQPAELRIHVSDTGIGIHRDDQERIFLEFEQGEHVGGYIGGTGLGLPIARRLAHMHNGELSVVSELGRGSTFSFRLPIRRPAAQPVPTVAPPAAPVLPVGPSAPSGALILAVDDFEVNLEILCMYLEGEGYRVIKATGGEEAITQAQEHLPDMILMDVKMAGIDGLEAIRRLKAIPQTRDIPVISLTAFASEADTERCLRAGAADYVSKPVNFPELGRKLMHHLPARV